MTPQEAYALTQAVEPLSMEMKQSRKLEDGHRDRMEKYAAMQVTVAGQQRNALELLALVATTKLIEGTDQARPLMGRVIQALERVVERQTTKERDGGD